MKSRWLAATLICGTLDIAYAIAMTLLNGGSPLRTLQGVASGPFGDAAVDWGVAGAVLGLAVHFAIMGVMVAALLAIVRHPRVRTFNPWLLGAVYGCILYGVMYWIVLPLRWGVFPQADLVKVGKALFAHVFLVGMPMAHIALRSPARMARADTP